MRSVGVRLSVRAVANHADVVEGPNNAMSNRFNSDCDCAFCAVVTFVRPRRFFVEHRLKTRAMDNAAIVWMMVEFDGACCGRRDVDGLCLRHRGILCG